MSERNALELMSAKTRIQELCEAQANALAMSLPTEYRFILFLVEAGRSFSDGQAAASMSVAQQTAVRVLSAWLDGVGVPTWFKAMTAGLGRALGCQPKPEVIIERAERLRRVFETCESMIENASKQERDEEWYRELVLAMASRS